MCIQIVCKGQGDNQMDQRTLSTASGRNYGIDALKLFSIFLATFMHVLGGQGPLSCAKGAAFAVCWLMETCGMYAVGCMGITTGYVSYSDNERPHRYSKYASRWLQVVFYSLGITLLLKLFLPGQVSVGMLVKSALPVSTNHYWYFTAYTGLFFIEPWLNKLVRSCSEKEMNLLMGIIFLLFSCYVTCTYIFEPVFHFGDGYSFPWLVVLYLVGAWMKKCAIVERIKGKFALICFVLCILVTWAVRVFGRSYLLLYYVSPTMLLAAVCITILFGKMRFGDRGKKLLACLAPAAFGVYLAHANQNAYYILWKDSFAWIAGMPVLLIPACAFACTAAIYISCLIVEKCRIWLFRVLKINERAEALCENAGARIAAALRRRIGA